MNLGFSEYVGDGTRRNPFRPKLEGSSIDLRPDCTVRDGYALVATEGRPKFKCGEDFKDTFGERVRRRVHNALGVDVTRVNRFDVLAAKLLLEPNGWKPIKPGPLRWEIWLGELLWEAPRASGGAVYTDNFNRADGNINVGVPSWTNLESFFFINGNSIIPNSFASDAVARWDGGAVGADQYAQVAVNVLGGGVGAGFGVALRQQATTADWYRVVTSQTGNTNYAEIAKFVSNTYTPLRQATPTFSPGDTFRGEVSGTSLRMLFNGVQLGTPVTDTSWSTGSVGLAYSSAVSSGLMDNWEGGDLTTAIVGTRRIRTSRGTSW